MTLGYPHERSYHLWTEDDEQVLTALTQKRYPILYMAKVLDRSKGAISARLKKRTLRSAEGRA